MVTSIHKIHFIAMYGSDCLMTQARNYGELLNKALQSKGGTLTRFGQAELLGALLAYQMTFTHSQSLQV